MQWMKNDRSLFLSSCNSLVWGFQVGLQSCSPAPAILGLSLACGFYSSNEWGAARVEVQGHRFPLQQTRQNWPCRFGCSTGRSLVTACKGLGGLSLAGAPQSYLQLWLWKMAWLWWSLRSPCEVGFLKGHFFPLCVLIVPRAWLMDFDFFCL